MSVNNLDKQLRKHSDSVQVIRDLENGIPVSVIDSIADYLEVPVNQLMNFMHISRSTWHRRKKTGKLDFNLSDKAVQVAKLLDYAERVLGEPQKVRSWLNIPSFVFENMRPIELIGSASGIALINDELTRIEHGVYI